MGNRAFIPRTCPVCFEPRDPRTPKGTMHEDCKGRAIAAMKRANKSAPRVVRLPARPR